MSRCESCLYRGGEQKTGCDYISMTGKSRVALAYRMLGVQTLTKAVLKLLKPRNCPCYRKGKRGEIRRLEMPTPFSLNRRRSFDVKKARELWAEGKTDSEIGETLGAKRDTISAWRRREGRENHAGRKRLDAARARELYELGWGDRRIAAAIGCARGTVYNWRIREGLASNEKKDGRHGKA